MLVTSTIFQQNVGHYLKLAEQGEDVQILRKKPRPFKFKLVAEGSVVNQERNVLDKLEEAKKRFNIKNGPRLGTNDSVEYQRKVRR